MRVRQFPPRPQNTEHFALTTFRRKITFTPPLIHVLEVLHSSMELLDDPPLLPYLAPLMQREIVFRLLMGSHGSHLRKQAEQAALVYKVAYEQPTFLASMNAFSSCSCAGSSKIRTS